MRDREEVSISVLDVPGRLAMPTVTGTTVDSSYKNYALKKMKHVITFIKLINR